MSFSGSDLTLRAGGSRRESRPARAVRRMGVTERTIRPFRRSTCIAESSMALTEPSYNLVFRSEKTFTISCAILESSVPLLIHEQRGCMNSRVGINVRIVQLLLWACAALALNVLNFILANETAYLPTRLSEPLRVLIPVLILLGFTLWSYVRDRSLKRLVALTLMSIILTRLIYENASLVVFIIHGGGGIA